MRQAIAFSIAALFAVTTVSGSTIEDLVPITNGDLEPVTGPVDALLHPVFDAVNGLELTDDHAHPPTHADPDCAFLGYQNDFDSTCDAPDVCTGEGGLLEASNSRTRFSFPADGLGEGLADIMLIDDDGLEDSVDHGWIDTSLQPLGQTIGIRYTPADLGNDAQEYLADQRVTLRVFDAGCGYGGSGGDERSDLTDPGSEYYTDGQATIAPPEGAEGWELRYADITLSEDECNDSQWTILLNQKKQLGYPEDPPLGQALFRWSNGLSEAVDLTKSNKGTDRWETSSNLGHTLESVSVYAPAESDTISWARHFQLVGGPCDAQDGGSLAGNTGHEVWFTPITEGPFIVEVTLVQDWITDDPTTTGEADPIGDLFRPKPMDCHRFTCFADLPVSGELDGFPTQK